MEKQAEVLNNEGVTLFMNGKLNDAKGKYLDALKSNPNHPAALNNLGLLYLQDKKLDEAEDCFQKAIAQDDKATYLLNMGHVYANKNMLERAEEYYKKSIEKDSCSLTAYQSLSGLYRFGGRYSESMHIWQKVIENIGDDESFLIELCRDLIAVQAYHNALEILSKMNDKGNFREKIWYLIALVHFHLSNFGMAESAVNQSLTAKPNNIDSHILAATIQLGKSNLKQAVEHWNFVLTVDKNNYRIRTDKAVALLANGFRNEALEALNEALIIEPKYEKALFYKALTWIEMGKLLDDAENILKDLININSSFAQRSKILLLKNK